METSLEPKKKMIFRGISVQLAGLPVDPKDCKHEEFIQAVVDHDADVVAIQEVGTELLTALVSMDSGRSGSVGTPGSMDTAARPSMLGTRMIMSTKKCSSTEELPS